MRSPATPVSSIFSKDFFARPTRPDRVSGHPVSQSVSQSVGWSVGQPVGEPVSRHLGFSETHPKRCASFFFPIPVPLYLFLYLYLFSSLSLSLSLSLSHSSYYLLLFLLFPSLSLSCPYSCPDSCPSISSYPPPHTSASFLRLLLPPPISSPIIRYSDG